MRTRAHARSLVTGVGLVITGALLVPVPRTVARAANDGPQAPLASDPCQSLDCYLRDSYLELLKISPQLQFTPAQIQDGRNALAESRTACESALVPADAPGASAASNPANPAADRSRAGASCALADLPSLEGRNAALAARLIPAAYASMETRLGILANWPADRQALRNSLNSGSYASRRWGNVEDIGFRTVAGHQEDDEKLGREIVRQLTSAHLLPALLTDDKVDYYVRAVAMRVAAHSDLRTALRVRVLDSDEVNAFCLPGGYLFIERGLLQAAEDESELAGVIAHEIAHAATRQGQQLLRGESAADIARETSKQIAAVFGQASKGQVNAALHSGVFGLGAVMDLKLLGVTPANEIEADRLGIQYAWSAGYDPAGFLRFFDKMAQAGYGPGLSWLRTHPPSYERIASAERETRYLPEKLKAAKQTSSFGDMRNELLHLADKAAQSGKSG